MKRSALLAALLIALVATPAPAAGATGFAAEIVSLSPALPNANSVVSLDVELSNPSSVSLYDVSARFLISTSPLYGRSQIPDVLAGRALPTYRLVEPSAATGIDLASGASTTITLRATPAQLGLTSARPGAYVFGVELHGTAAGKSVTERRITFLPWASGTSGRGLGVLTVWTLTAPPSRGVDDVFLDESLAKSITAGGQLRRQLDAMRVVPRALWLVDPLLVEDVRALANGARIQGADGKVRATTDAEMQAASQWLADLRSAVSTGSLAALPLGDLDVRAALKFGRLTVVRTALNDAAPRLANALQLTSVPLIVPLYGGAVTESSWRFLRSAGVTTAIVSSQGYPATQSTYTPTSRVSVPAFERAVLVTDQITGATLASSGLSSTEARQAFASQLLMTYLERPNSDRVITIAVPPTWIPDASASAAGVLNADWVTHVSLAQARRSGFEPRDTQITSATQGQRLQNVDLGRAVAAQRMLMHLTQDESFTTSVRTSVIGTLSRWWTARGLEDRYSATTIASLSSLADSVRVVTRGDIVFGAESGVVPVTVANGLPVAVDIQLRATGYPSVRVRPTQLTTLHLNAGKRASLEVPTRVTGSGDAFLGLQLQSSDATPIGEPVLLTVRSAAYARVAGYLVMGAFALLLLLVIANTVKRIRNRGSEEDE